MLPIACLSAISFAIMPGGECLDLSAWTSPGSSRAPVAAIAQAAAQRGIELRIVEGEKWGDESWQFTYEIKNSSAMDVDYLEFSITTPEGITDWSNHTTIPSGATVKGSTFVPVRDSNALRRDRLTGAITDVRASGRALVVPTTFVDGREAKSVQRNGIKF